MTFAVLFHVAAAPSDSYLDESSQYFHSSQLQAPHVVADQSGLLHSKQARGRMKLRITNNSIRFRVLRSEVTELIKSGRIEETIHFTSDRQPSLTYALEKEIGLMSMQLRYEPSEVAILLPNEEAEAWATGNHVGIYATVARGENGTLSLVVEKDFACLDLSDADSLDTFPNPQLGAVC
jgi:hypothetical protein